MAALRSLGDTQYRRTRRFTRSISNDADGTEIRHSLRVGGRGRDHERYQCNAERSEHDGGQRAAVGNVQGAAEMGTFCAAMLAPTAFATMARVTNARTVVGE